MNYTNEFPASGSNGGYLIFFLAIHLTPILYSLTYFLVLYLTFYLAFYLILPEYYTLYRYLYFDILSGVPASGAGSMVFLSRCGENDVALFLNSRDPHMAAGEQTETLGTLQDLQDLKNRNNPTLGFSHISLLIGAPIGNCLGFEPFRFSLHAWIAEVSTLSREVDHCEVDPVGDTLAEEGIVRNCFKCWKSLHEIMKDIRFFLDIYRFYCSKFKNRRFLTLSLQALRHFANAEMKGLKV